MSDDIIVPKIKTWGELIQYSSELGYSVEWNGNLYKYGPDENGFIFSRNGEILYHGEVLFSNRTLTQAYLLMLALEPDND